MIRGTTSFLKVSVLIFGTVIFALSIFFLPWLAEYTAAMYPEFAFLKTPVLIGLYITVIPFSIALFRILKLLSRVEENKIFSEWSVKALRDIKYCATSILLIYVVGSIFLMTQSALHPGIAITGFTIMFITTFIALFSTVLQRLLRNALNIKSENDLII